MIGRGVEAAEDADPLVQVQHVLDGGAFAMDAVKLDRIVLQAGRLVDDLLRDEELVLEEGDRTDHIAVVLLSGQVGARVADNLTWAVEVVDASLELDQLLRLFSEMLNAKQKRTLDQIYPRFELGDHVQNQVLVG